MRAAERRFKGMGSVPSETAPLQEAGELPARVLLWALQGLQGLQASRSA